MVLHVFNPEHDLALASGLCNFTAPHAGRQLHADLCYLPALWAAPDDCVLVDDVDAAQTAFGRVAHRVFPGFVVKHQLPRLDITHVEPWGWDAALRSFLLRHGVSPEACASESDIETIRTLSHRQTAVSILPSLRVEGTVGESLMADSVEDVIEAIHRWGRVVVKAPWSSSGRGIRFISQSLDSYQMGWLKNIILRQGSVTVEPEYNKVKDFAMEFFSDGKGQVTYRGLSLFHTANGAYAGNILAYEDEKLKIISRYVSEDLLTAIQQKICHLLSSVLSRYYGPFGVDMMIVSRPDADGFLLHPCVEINLRRTMGHVALALSSSLPSQQVMNIDYTDNHYKLKIRAI